MIVDWLEAHLVEVGYAAGVLFAFAAVALVLLGWRGRDRDAAPSEVPRIVADATAEIPPVTGRHRRRRPAPRVVRHPEPPPGPVQIRSVGVYRSSSAARGDHCG